MILPKEIEFFCLDMARSAHYICPNIFGQSLEYFAVCIISTKNIIDSRN